MNEWMIEWMRWTDENKEGRKEGMTEWMNDQTMNVWMNK